jgi:hypothetical protein
MKKPIRFFATVGMMSLLTLLSAQSFAAPPKEGAVICDKCKIVMVKYPIHTGIRGQTIIYQEGKTMVCPYCVSAMENFFKTGKLKHTCTHCGGTMTICH